jgi:DNA-binding transcriptional LysR family regulator
VAERCGTLAGPLRISAPVSFGIMHLGPAIYRFLADNPGVELSLELDDRFVDVAADGFDAVVRHGPIRDSRLVAKPLATSQRVLVASPSYLAEHGQPRSLAELEGRRATLYTNRDPDWRFSGPEGTCIVRPRKWLPVNNGMIMRDAALAGLGITLLATFIIHAELASGALRAISSDIFADMCRSTGFTRCAC